MGRLTAWRILAGQLDRPMSWLVSRRICRRRLLHRLFEVGYDIDLNDDEPSSRFGRFPYTGPTHQIRETTEISVRALQADAHAQATVTPYQSHKLKSGDLGYDLLDDNQDLFSPLLCDLNQRHIAPTRLRWTLAGRSSRPRSIDP